jgi:DNA-binding LacI/PurR family transcriptional regulator
VIGLIAFGAEHGVFIPQNRRISYFFRAVEVESTQRGLRTRKIAYNDAQDNPGYVQHDNSRSPNDPGIGNMLGCIVVATAIQRPDALIRSLMRSGRPVAVIIENSTGLAHSLPAKKPPVRVFQVGVTNTCATATAEMLVHYGHRHIAFFSPFHDTEWSRTRFRAIYDSMKARTPDTAVSLFALTEFTSYWDMGCAAEERFGINARQKMRDILPQSIRNLATHQFDDLWRAYHGLLGNAFLFMRMTPLFKQALSDKSITAWLGANDDIALMALQYLKIKGIAVPGRISVAGFDDIPAAYDVGLTSYNFSLPVVAMQAVRHVVSPSDPVFGPLHRPVELPGKVILRETVGPRS